MTDRIPEEELREIGAQLKVMDGISRTSAARLLSALRASYVGQDECRELLRDASPKGPYTVQLFERTERAELAMTDLAVRLEDTLAEQDRIKSALFKTNHEVEQTLGKALHYPQFMGDQKNWPGTIEEDGVCIGPHVPESIAVEAAAQIKALEEALAKEEREGMKALKEIEKYEEFIDHSARELGITAEWSNVYGLCELSEEQGDVVYALRKRITELEAEREQHSNEWAETTQLFERAEKAEAISGAVDKILGECTKERDTLKAERDTQAARIAALEEGLRKLQRDAFGAGVSSDPIACPEFILSLLERIDALLPKEEISKEDFQEHLDRNSKVVEDMPDWKRRVITGSKKEGKSDE